MDDRDSGSQFSLVHRLGLGIWLVRLLHRSAAAGNAAQNLAWAMTLTWTLIMNVYVPVYDTLLIAVAVTLTIGALKEDEE